jgi:hypothetical protein
LDEGDCEIFRATNLLNCLGALVVRVCGIHIPSLASSRTCTLHSLEC